VDRADRGPPAGAQVIDRGLDVLGRRSQRHEDGVRVAGLVLAHQAVVPSRQRREVAIRVVEEVEDRLDEVVPARHHALHVVLLVLHRTEEHRVGEVDHLRHATARRAEQDALALGGTFDDVLRGAEVLADE
jgi:hypothetical protein